MNSGRPKVSAPAAAKRPGTQARGEPGARTARTAPRGTQTLTRGLAVVDAVARGARDLKEVGQATGTTRSTTHRLVTCLVQAGYLRSIDGHGLRLGPRLIEFGYQAREELSLPAVGRPYLEALAAATGDTVHLGVRDGDDVLYLDKISGTKGLEMRSRIGHRMPLANTGMGKALLLDAGEAEWKGLYDAAAAAVANSDAPLAKPTWDEFRERMRRYAADEYAFDLEENEASIRCVAAPIRDAQRRIVAAVSVSSTIPYMPMKRMRELVPMIHRATAGISAQLGWRAGLSTEAGRAGTRVRG